MRFIAIHFFIISALLSGCSVSSPPPPRPTVIKFKKPKPLESVPKLVGIVSMVNADGQFVLVESNQSATLDSGTALKCFRDGVESGVLAVGSERRRPYVTADIVTGEPQRGDQVFE
jgi:hypothetical protein